MTPKASPEGASPVTGDAASKPRASVLALATDWLARFLLLAAIAAIFLAIAGYTTKRLFAPAEIQSGQGYAYSVDLSTENIFLTPRPLDGWSAARPSEGGRPLGPKAKQRDQVADLGKGLYRHEGTVLHFSTSDNSDPRVNGRSYSATYRLHGRVWLAALLALGAMLVVVLSLDRRDDEPRGTAIKRRLETLLFGLPLRLVGRAAALCLGIIILVLAFNYRDIAYGVTAFFSVFAGILVFLGLCAMAGFLLARGVSERGAQPLRSLAQSAVLLILAMGLQREVLSIAQLVVFVAGGGAYALMRRSTDRAQWAQHWITRLTQTGEQAEPGLVRRLVALAMIFCFVSVLPGVVRFWDQSGWNDSDGYDRDAHAIATGMNLLGSGDYMPLYQYGMAVFYWAFGHFIYVQQVVNVALAVAGTGLVAAAAWLLFRQPLAVLVVGLVAAVWRPLHHAVWATQIEGWYIPIFALSVLALVNYLARHTIWALLLLAVAAALVFNMRLQGAFYAAALGLAVLFVFGLNWRNRLRHLGAFALVFLVIGVGPWTLRNGLVEGRFSPSSEQSISSLAFYNDPRIPLYGIRYWENVQEVVQDWRRKFPDKAEREAAQQRYFYDRLLNDTDYFVAAAPWRFLAFYGLLPPGTLAEDGPRATDWPGEGRQFISQRARFWAPIAVSIIGWLATIGSRFNLLFAGLIFANIIVAFSTGFSEPRLAYPVVILHLLMGFAVFAPYAVDAPGGAGPPVFRAWLRQLAAVALCLVVILPLAHIVVGREFAFRPLPVEAWVRDPQTSIDTTLPLVSVQDGHLTVDGARVDALTVGERYRGRFAVNGTMHSPRWICCRTDFIRRMSRPDGVTYFVARLRNDLGEGFSVAIRFTGTRVAQPIREDATIDAEFRVDSNTTVPGYPGRFWANVEAAVVARQPGESDGQ